MGVGYTINNDVFGIFFHCGLLVFLNAAIKYKDFWLQYKNMDNSLCIYFQNEIFPFNAIPYKR